MHAEADQQGQELEYDQTGEYKAEDQYYYNEEGVCLMSKSSR